ncbi:MAG: hypothetical protein A2X05_13340 [Bacteroidetes bacterium GWE2_41_25]|nr:MAG: hypothetical protein A2X03_03215 [Bacteroidetes bacterium GWA2_40_15]OFX95437.1 MAG: hypothetical protein A2X05_13340 [Bacteroidetes bacterium GWE2_41_25]OFY59710.1 MAG: hypothetical protein A2X04_14655 [Bacteroidetes bacterium GWF2_41_9]HAN21158.1 hypothetical protein [Clostridiales bacterium]
MIAVLVINATHEAYHTKKYLAEDEEYNVSPSHTTVTGDNVIIGNNYGSIKQADNFVGAENSSDKPKWLKWVGWILAAVLAIFGIAELIQKLFFN